MADVRANVGVPVAAQFGGLATPTMCAPLVVNSSTGYIYSLTAAGAVVAAGAEGTVTSVALTFTGGIVSVAGSPVTGDGTLALTVAGTSGGVPYFNSATTWASSGALAANAIVLGGGAGAAPATTTTGTGVVTALGVNVGSAGAFVTFNGAGGTPSSIVLTNATGTAAGLTAGTASAVAVGGITGLGTGVATALAVNVGTAGAFVVLNGALGSPSSAGTLPAFTLGGTISGGGNQINNVIIGASTPLAGSFTTVSASGTVAMTATTNTIITDLSGTTGLAVQDTTDTAGASYIRFNKANGTLIGNIARNGATDAVVYNTTSDARLKKNIKDADGEAALARVMAYKIRAYEWNDDPGVTYEGPIAQEVHEINPRLVTPPHELDGAMTPWQVNMQGFIPDLILAVQYLAKRAP